jgi:hypothetical protein
VLRRAGCPDARGLAYFYSDLLGWQIASESDHYCALGDNVRVLLDPAGHPLRLYRTLPERSVRRMCRPEPSVGDGAEAG